MSDELTIEQVRERLRAACREAGSQAAFAKHCGVSGVYISDVLRGRRDPGDSIVAALGLEREVIVRRDVIYRVAGGVLRAKGQTGPDKRRGRA